MAKDKEDEIIKDVIEALTEVGMETNCLLSKGDQWFLLREGELVQVHVDDEGNVEDIH